MGQYTLLNTFVAGVDPCGTPAPGLNSMSPSDACILHVWAVTCWHSNVAVSVYLSVQCSIIVSLTLFVSGDGKAFFIS